MSALWLPRDLGQNISTSRDFVTPVDIEFKHILVRKVRSALSVREILFKPKFLSRQIV